MTFWIVLQLLGFAPSPNFTALDKTGTVLSGAAVCVFEAWTTKPATSFATPEVSGKAAIPNANPVIMNARGQASIYLIPHKRYTLVLLRPRLDFNYSCEHYEPRDVVAAWSDVSYHPAKKRKP